MDRYTIGYTRERDMGDVTMRQLPKAVEPTDDYLILTAEPYTGHNATMSISQLLGLQQAALNKPCSHCGSRGKFDIRGNCGSCGAPV